MKELRPENYSERYALMSARYRTPLFIIVSWVVCTCAFFATGFAASMSKEPEMFAWSVGVFMGLLVEDIALTVWHRSSWITDQLKELEK